jgi:SAM-dependent methyltransferase
MNESVRQRLLAINREFYEQFGASFSGTRFGAQPGWDRIIHYFPRRGAVLDLGCGNGRLALFLEKWIGDRGAETKEDHAGPRAPISGPIIRYVGLEGSSALLAIAREQTANLQRVSTEFFQVDLSSPEWHRESHYFDVVTALAVLHHIPGFEARRAFIAAAGGCLKPGGVLILSNWRFIQNPRMRRKLLPWSAAGLSEADVESGDYLLDWKKDGGGMRYAHQLDESEVVRLAAAAGLKVETHFTADGRERDLRLYSILRA